MVEGGAVAGLTTPTNWVRLIETDDFNQAVDDVMTWVETNSSWNETLLIVTGDHETGFLWGPNQSASAQW